ncbi:MAG: hypothetical protein SNH79_02510 [Rikenellaceae bacterium]
MENLKIWWWNEGFYDTEQEGCVELSHEQREALIAGERAGKYIVTGDDGYPMLTTHYTKVF